MSYPSVDEIRELCRGDKEVEVMTDAEVEALQACCFRIAVCLLDTVKGDSKWDTTTNVQGAESQPNTK